MSEWDIASLSPSETHTLDSEIYINYSCETNWILIYWSYYCVHVWPGDFTSLTHTYF
jgi:hypothetical protein